MSPYTRIILQSLMENPKTRMEVAACSSVERSTVYYQMTRLHKIGEIYICDWKRYDFNVRFQPVFAAGKGIDMPCQLEMKSSLQRNRDYIKRIREAGEIEHYRARKMAQLRARNAARGPKQGPFAALFGAAA